MVFFIYQTIKKIIVPQNGQLLPSTLKEIDYMFLKVSLIWQFEVSVVDQTRDINFLIHPTL